MGVLKNDFPVYNLGKQFFGHPSRIDDVPIKLTQFCYKIRLMSWVSMNVINTYFKNPYVYIKPCTDVASNSLVIGRSKFEVMFMLNILLAILSYFSLLSTNFKWFSLLISEYHKLSFDSSKNNMM